MKKLNLIIITAILVFYNCSSTKYTKRLPLNIDLIDDSYIMKDSNDFTLDSITTDFYSVNVLLDTKNSYSQSEQKYFNVRIINYGQKDLFIPEWLTIKELKIEIYKKNGKKFTPYEQKRILTTTHITFSDTKDRQIKSLKNGELVCFKNMELDRYLKIVDEGEYFVRLYIDLSNFGYFKTLIKDSRTFKVVN